MRLTHIIIKERRQATAHPLPDGNGPTRSQQWLFAKTQTIEKQSSHGRSTCKLVGNAGAYV